MTDIAATIKDVAESTGLSIATISKYDIFTADERLKGYIRVHENYTINETFSLYKEMVDVLKYMKN